MTEAHVQEEDRFCSGHSQLEVVKGISREMFKQYLEMQSPEQRSGQTQMWGKSLRENKEATDDSGSFPTVLHHPFFPSSSLIGFWGALS